MLRRQVIEVRGFCRNLQIALFNVCGLIYLLQQYFASFQCNFSTRPQLSIVIVVTPGNFCGEHSLLTGRVRNTTATCISSEGCVTLRLLGRDFRKLMDVQPRLKESLVDMMNRRNFKKAVVLRL